MTPLQPAPSSPPDKVIPNQQAPANSTPLNTNTQLLHLRFSTTNNESTHPIHASVPFVPSSSSKAHTAYIQHPRSAGACAGTISTLYNYRLLVTSVVRPARHSIHARHCGARTTHKTRRPVSLSKIPEGTLASWLLLRSLRKHRRVVSVTVSVAKPRPAPSLEPPMMMVS